MSAAKQYWRIYMKRRIFAWVLLTAFVLLLLNIMFIKFYWQLSAVVYVIIAFGFLLYNNKLTRAMKEEKILKDMADNKDGVDKDTDINTDNGADSNIDQ
jgi:hypothetical protein